MSSDETIKSSDLTHEANTDRGVFDPKDHLEQAEKAELEGKTGWLGDLITKLVTQLYAGSPPSTVMTAAKPPVSARSRISEGGRRYADDAGPVVGADDG